MVPLGDAQHYHPHFTVDKLRPRKLSHGPMCTLLVGGVPTLKRCEAAALSHWALSCGSPKSNVPLYLFLPVTQNQSSGIFMKCLFRDLTRVGLRNSVGLQMPIPGFREHNSFRHSLGLKMTLPCVVLKGERGLQLIEETEAGAGTSQESVAPRLGCLLDRKSKANLTN